MPFSNFTIIMLILGMIILIGGVLSKKKWIIILATLPLAISITQMVKLVKFVTQ